MRKLLTALATTSMLMASNATIWKAEAAMVTGVGNRLWRIAIRPSKRFAVSAARMDAPADAAIGDLMVVRATRAIGRIDITALAIGPTVRIAGAGSKEPEPKPS